MVAQTVKDLPAIWETQVQFLGLEDPLEKEIATYSSILAWIIPWTEEPGGLQFMGLQRVRCDLANKQYFSVQVGLVTEEKKFFFSKLTLRDS